MRAGDPEQSKNGYFGGGKVRNASWESERSGTLVLEEPYE